jgi:disulfide bond formation protein DsbB
MKVKQYASYLPYVVFIVALISTLWSLSLSEIFHYPPCVLCWYQRICMYPLTVISAVAIIKKRQIDLPYYMLPLSIIGFIIALYQNLLIWGVLSEKVAPCQAGVSCIHQPVAIYGFITIPLGSMISFAGITAFMLLYAKFGKGRTNNTSENSLADNKIKTSKKKVKK